MSSCLQNITISAFELKWHDLCQLYQYTPHLKYFEIYVSRSNDDDYKPFPMPTLRSLKITISNLSDYSKLFSLLQNAPNLRQLSVKLYDAIINGDQWEKTICNYLPKLKVLKLRMREQYFGDQNGMERINQLITSFQNSFWTDEHK